MEKNASIVYASPMSENWLDILIGLHVVLQIALLLVSGARNRILFQRMVLGVALFQIGTQVALLWSVLSGEGAGGIISAFGEFIAGPYPIGGWTFLLISYLFYAVVLRGVLRDKEFICRGLHRTVTWLAALFVFLLLPALTFGKYVLSSGLTFADAFRTQSVIAVGYGFILLRLEVLRTLALGSYSHRNLIAEDPMMLKKDEKRVNGWALLFGVRWYFYKGLLKKGWLLMIPYTLLLVPGLPKQILFPLALIGTRIYCGLKGNGDYASMKAGEKKGS